MCLLWESRRTLIFKFYSINDSFMIVLLFSTHFSNSFYILKVLIGNNAKVTPRGTITTKPNLKTCSHSQHIIRLLLRGLSVCDVRIWNKKKKKTPDKENDISSSWVHAASEMTLCHCLNVKHCVFFVLYACRLAESRRVSGDMSA